MALVDEYPSEEKTEPFTLEEMSRLHGSLHVEDVDETVDDTVPLDTLILDDHHHKQGIRLLVRPLTKSRSVSPGNDNCQWLALRTDRADPLQPKSKVMAVTQTSKDINFSIRIPGEQGEDSVRHPIWCKLYYNPTGDSVILENQSEVPILLARISRPPRGGGASLDLEIVPSDVRDLTPGTWRISVSGEPVLDFRILGKHPAMLRSAALRATSSLSLIASQDTINTSFKRARSDSDDEDGEDEGRVRGRKYLRETSPIAGGGGGEGEENRVVVVHGLKDESLEIPLPRAARTKEVAIPNGHALLELEPEETAVIPGGSEAERYAVEKKQQIALSGASSVFTARHSQVPSGGGVITVKVLKTVSPGEAKHPQQQRHSSRQVIHQANVWLREYQSQEDLQHDSIVKLYGGDARYLSLYMEHVDGNDLAARSQWRDGASDFFRGERRDAVRILRDIAGALNYVHQKRKVHNDIKPANILYSRERGAVLCDFGLSSHFSDPATVGGTPYYVPPEFIMQKSRGAASDVWALGVTMLYVLRKIAFPDARGRHDHPKQLYWMIADVNKRSHHHHHHRPSAAHQMQQWLTEVYEAKKRLKTADKLEALVAQMLAPLPQHRITMAEVMSELFKEPAKKKDVIAPVAAAAT